MAKSKGSMIGLVGGVLIGAAILLFVATLVLNNLKSAGDPGIPATGANDDANNASWEELNSTVDQIKTMLTVSSILMAVMGIVVVGSQIIAYIGGGFGA